MSSNINVDSKLKAIGIRILNSADLINGSFEPKMLKVWWTQLGKNGQAKEMKTRVHDHLRAAGLDIALSDVRLWLY